MVKKRIVSKQKNWRTNRRTFNEQRTFASRANFRRSAAGRGRSFSFERPCVPSLVRTRTFARASALGAGLPTAECTAPASASAGAQPPRDDVASIVLGVEPAALDGRDRPALDRLHQPIQREVLALLRQRWSGDGSDSGRRSVHALAVNCLCYVQLRLRLRRRRAEDSGRRHPGGIQGCIITCHFLR